MDVNLDPALDRDEFISRLDATFSLNSLSEKYGVAVLKDDVLEKAAIRDKYFKMKARHDHYLLAYDAGVDEKEKRRVVSSVIFDYVPTQEEYLAAQE